MFGLFGSSVMAKLSILMIVMGLLFSKNAMAQPEMQKPARILFLLDASSSMLGDWAKTENRFTAAGRIINSIVDSIHKINPDVAFGIRVFGNQYPAQDKNCYDTRLEVPFRLENDDQIKTRLKHLTPLGSSPIALSLKEAAEKDFIQSTQYAYSIILITDGGESCGGDICATVTNLLQKKISFKPYILSMIDYEPLKKEYDCLGKYLTVAKEQDIVPAISTIINDNRKVLTIKSSNTQKIAVENKIEVKPPLPVKPIVVAPKKEEPPKVEIDTIVTSISITPPPRRQKPLLRIFYLTTPRKQNLLYVPFQMDYIKVPKLVNIRFNTDEDTAPTVPTGSVPKPTGNPTPTAPANERRRVIVEPTVGFNEPRKAATFPPKKEKTSEDALLVDQKKEVSAESKLQIFFTDGKGKFYNTEPKLKIIDSKTGKVVKETFRNVTAGVPDAIQLPPGTYDIQIPGSKSKANTISVDPGKITKANIIVNKGSLAFYHPTNPDASLKQYRALVSKRFERGAVIPQNLDEELPYEPANYHIEVNTLPPSTFNVDLDFNNVKLISIPEPGDLIIANTNNLGKIQLWYQLGDAYVPFYDMTIAGKIDKQKVELLPGLYQARYFLSGSKPGAKAEVVYFRITGRKTTTVTLD